MTHRRHFLGAFAGAVIGGAVGGVAVLISYPVGSDVVGTNWWLYATMGGGLLTSVVLALRRLTGWEIPNGDHEEEEEESDEEEEGEEEPQTPRSVVCRKCRMPVDCGLTECRYCRAPVRARRGWPIGRMFTGVGIVCVVGTSFGWGVLQSCLVGKGFNPTVLSYLFWMISFGGWIMIGIGCLLSSSKPVRGSRGDSGGTDKTEGETEPSGEVPFGVDTRPMPTGDDLDTLLPSQVGAFGRVELRPCDDIHSDPIYATYRAGESEVFVELGLCGSADVAQEALATAKENSPSDVVTQAWSSGADPSFFMAGGVFMAWTRGGYFFVAAAKSEAGLDALMKAFPY